LGGPAGLIVNGLIALILSLLIWRLTENLWAWLVLFIPGGCLVVRGWVAICREP
jgi:hypothetical protein